MRWRRPRGCCSSWPGSSRCSNARVANALADTIGTARAHRALLAQPPGGGSARRARLADRALEAPLLEGGSLGGGALRRDTASDRRERLTAGAARIGEVLTTVCCVPPVRGLPSPLGGRDGVRCTIAKQGAGKRQVSHREMCACCVCATFVAVCMSGRAHGTRGRGGEERENIERSCA